ncbi:aspartate kinase, partial [Escherichia coli]|nr:aspartate kinase [Escherichia coli]
MSVSVLKYGGSSVSNFDQIKDIARYIQKRVDQGDQCIVVVSAMG